MRRYKERVASEAQEEGGSSVKSPTLLGRLSESWDISDTLPSTNMRPFGVCV